MPRQNFSFSQQTWQRLKKNRGAVFGMVIIGIAIFISLFGYLVAPDASPNADLQTVEIQAKKPGYTQLFLKIPTTKNTTIGWFTTLTNGEAENFRYLPISRYRIIGDSLLVNKYVDEDTSVLQIYSINLLTGRQPHNVLLQNIVTKKYYLGTDKFGRDILSRLIIGTKVSLAVNDAFVSCWRCKYAYNLMRPQTYIRQSIDPTWSPMIGTPPFPEYTSGHSSGSGAASEALTTIFGDNYAFTDNTHTGKFPDRSFKSFYEYANEATLSRLYGGIHYRQGNELPRRPVPRGHGRPRTPGACKAVGR